MTVSHVKPQVYKLLAFVK